MAIPSGSGTEILNRAGGVLSNSTNNTIFTVGTGKIHTVISILAMGTQATSSTLWIIVNIGGTNRILAHESLGQYDTFVFNDKIVLYPTDVLIVDEGANYDMNYWVSWIEQDFGS